MSDVFNGLRLAAMDRLRRDGELSAAARLVGLEILSHVNRASMDAWPSESTLAAALGLDIKTVKRAVPVLEAAGYFVISRRRRYSNRYRPVFETGIEPQSTPFEHNGAGDRITAIGDKYGPSTGDKNGPRSPLSKSIRTPSTDITSRNEQSESSEKQRTCEHREDLRERRGDEKIEAELVRQLGADGLDVMGRLHEIDGGRPRLRVISKARAGRLSLEDLSAARLAAQRCEDSSWLAVRVPKRGIELAPRRVISRFCG